MPETNQGSSLHDLLRDWPYARDYLLSTMDGELIEAHAFRQLSRALNVGSVVAFLSAGVSMAYGRISWRQLVVELADEAMKDYEDKYPTPSDRNARPRLARLYQNLKSLNIKNRSRNDDIKPERYPSVFQLCAELSTAIADDKAQGQAEREQFSGKVKLRTRDGHFHAISLLDRHLKEKIREDKEGDDKGDDNDKLVEAIRELRQAWNRYEPNRAQLFKTQNIIDCIFHEDRSFPEDRRLVPELCKLLGLPGTPALRTLKPSLRFLVPAAVRATNNPKQRRRIAKLVRAYTKELTGGSNVAVARNRQSTIAPASDIVGTLRFRLAIRRFLTTNYDLELERLIFDQGFVSRKGVYSVDPLDHMARDFVVRPEDSATLVDLALQGGGHRMDIAHLHGRALPDEPIVATETEYQERYLRDDEYRDPLEDAITLAFRGNTMLFVGSGMGEDDILRPLRHFMSEEGGPTQPASIALLPIRGTDPSVVGASVIEEKISLLRRYGVYTIHWGRGRTAGMDANAAPVPLLPAIRSLIAAAQEMLNSEERRSEAKKAKWTAALEAAESVCLFSRDSPRLESVVEIEELTQSSDPSASLNEIIGIEWAALDFLVRTTDACVRGQRPDKDVVAAAGIIAAELEDAVMSAFLTAAVHRLAKHWDGWRKDWFGEIMTRPPEPNAEEDERPPPPGQAAKWISNDFNISRRRALALRPSPKAPAPKRKGSVPPTDRLYRPRWSQAYSDFLSALREGGKMGRIPKEGRRVFFLAGRRGIGKGHFFSALTDREAFLDYATSAGSAELIYGLYAFNLSFSVELGSGFEIMAEFIFDSICKMYKDQPFNGRERHIDALKAEYNRFTGRSNDRSGDRVGVLRFLFEVMSGTAAVTSPAWTETQTSPDNHDPLREKIPPDQKGAPIHFTLEKPYGRIVLALNATHLLFNPRGFAKSSDVVRFLEVFLDPTFNAANVDLIFVTSETGLPIEVRYPLDRKPDDPSRVLIGDENQVQHVDLVPLPVIGRSALSRLGDEATLADLRLRLTTNIPPRQNGAIAAYFYRLTPPRISVVIMSAFPGVALVLASQCRLLQPFVHRQGGRALHELLSKLDFEEAFAEPGPLGESTRISVRDASEKIAEKAYDVFVRPAEPGRAGVIHSLVEELDRKFADLYRALGRNRFCVSIVCSAVDEIIECRGTLADASSKLTAFMSTFSGPVVQSREDTLLREVLDHYRREAAKGISFDFPLRSCAEELPKREDAVFLLELPNFSSDFQMLQEEVMAILAMIGTPVEADCLSHLKIHALEALEEKVRAQEDCEEKAAWLKEWRVRDFLIEEALERLVRRSLVFRFVPRSEVSRFGVHRLVQRHGLRRMHQPRVEFPEVDNYMPTLYASQPNDLPYPTADAQERIRDMVARLSFYPSSHRWGPSGFVPSVGPARAARMLRAAYSILRGVYSIASVARLDANVPAIKPPLHGFFEAHRHNIRWLLRRARVLQEHLTPQERPFFAGDIVWLYNECGTLSLVQGSLHDAAKLLSVGLKAVQRIESPAIGGALTNTLRLNRAVVDIEMGKCRKAGAALAAIASARQENRAVRWIARGYLGLVAHIRGDSKLAEENYRDAIGALRFMKRHRAASIFARHCADLYRHAASSRIEEALAMADDAVKFASIGNHEDVYHRARLTRLRTQLEEQRLKVENKLSRDMSDARKTLESIERYARIMGMPRLLIETGQIDALFRLDTGDLHYASRSVTRALALANENGLLLKKVSLMVLLAKIYLQRGMTEGARLLAESARNLAIQCEYATVQDEAQELLTRV